MAVRRIIEALVKQISWLYWLAVLVRRWRVRGAFVNGEIRLGVDWVVERWCGVLLVGVVEMVGEDWVINKKYTSFL
jgi:hypothetical protein